MELLVAMIISGIVMSIASLVWNIVFKQYESYKKANENISNTLLLNTLLQNDFQKAQLITKINETEILFTDKTDHQDQTIIYRFEQNYILRNLNNIPDTFSLTTNNMQIKFQNKKQEMQNGLMDELQFESVILNEREQFHFKKQYGADILMKANEQE